MTPRDFRVLVEAKAEQRDHEHEFQDGLNGVVCSVIASVNGVKNAKPADFMITRREPENKEETTVESINRGFEMWSAMTRGRG